MATQSLLPPMAPSKDPADYPAFRGGISRWLWRAYTQRLTPAGRWFALASAIFIAYGGTSLEIQGYVLAMYVGVMWAIAVLAIKWYRPKVTLQAFNSPRVCAGQTAQVELEIQQLGRLGGADLLVLPHRLPPEIDAVPAYGLPLDDLKRGQTARVRIGLLCKKRGGYLIHGFRVETGFPFGIIRASRLIAQERKLLVYPQFHPLARLTLPTGRRYQPGGVALASNLGESFEYLGNREYRDGDSVKDIDWRATARIGRPIVREWVEEYMLRCAVILDTHIPPKLGLRQTQLRRDDFERAVSVCAAVSDYMARQDYLVDIFAAGPNLYHLTAGRSLAYLDQILDILAAVGENPKEPFETIEPQIDELIERLSTVICVFLDWNGPRRAFVHRLQERGVAVKVIILRDGKCTDDPNGDPEMLGATPVVGKAEYERGISDL